MAYDVVTRAPGQDVSPTASPTFVTVNATTLTDGMATLTGGVLTTTGDIKILSNTAGLILGALQGTTLKSALAGNLTILNTPGGGASLTLDNGTENPTVFSIDATVATSVDVISGAAFDYTVFKSAASGETPTMRISGYPAGESLKYGQFQVVTGPKFQITSDSGAIDFDNENLSTTGTLGAGAITGTSFTDSTATLTGGSLTSVKLGTLTTNGFVKTSGADGTLSVDTSTYLTAEVDTLDTVSDRGATTDQSLTTGGYTTDGILTVDPASLAGTWVPTNTFGGFIGTQVTGSGDGIYRVGIAAIAETQHTDTLTALVGVGGYSMMATANNITAVAGLDFACHSAVAGGAITSWTGIRSFSGSSFGAYKNVTTLKGIEVDFGFAGFGAGRTTITTQYGIYVADIGAATIVTNSYGLYLPAVTRGSSQNWSIYTQGGDIGIIADNTSLVFGAGSDASIQYNGTNLLVNPKDVGSGVVLLDTDSKLCPRDAAIGIYSQADTFLDLFADGAVRIGDSSAGAPTNYANFAPDGELTLHGTARVSRETWVPATGLKAPGTKPATSVEIGISSAWEFTDATDDTLTGKISVPNNADVSENASFTIGWSSPTADPGDDSKQAVWQLEYALHAPGQDMDGAAETTKTATASASTTADGLVMTEITGISEAEAGDVCFEFRLKRLGADGDDDLGDVAHVHGVCMKFVSNKLGAAT